MCNYVRRVVKFIAISRDFYCRLVASVRKEGKCSRGATVFAALRSLEDKREICCNSQIARSPLRGGLVARSALNRRARNPMTTFREENERTEHLEPCNCREDEDEARRRDVAG